MALRRNQLKKLTLPQIMDLLHNEQDHSNLLLISSFIHDKNDSLQDKRTSLLQQIQQTRHKIDKSVHGLNARVKDRIDKNIMTVMNKDSRPTNQDVTQLMDLYAYIENQCAIIDRNHHHIAVLSQDAKAQCEDLHELLDSSPNYQSLDNKYASLNRLCQEEERLRDALLQQRSSKRTHYADIHSSIEQCRNEYEIVEAKIREKERQLIQLNTYYHSRQNEDTALLKQLPEQAVLFESQLLQAQGRLNEYQYILQDRVLKDLEAQATVPE